MSAFGRPIMLSKLPFSKWPTHDITKDPFEMQDRPVDCNVTGGEELVDVVSDSMLELTCKELPLAKFRYSVKEKHPQINRKSLTLLPSPPSADPHVTGVSLSTSIETTRCSKWARSKSENLPSFSYARLKRFAKNMRQCLSSHWILFCSGEYRLSS